MFQRLRSRMSALGRRRAFENEMADELSFHIDAYAEDLVRAGVPPAEARRRARLEFGNVDNVRADCREERGLIAFDTLQAHARHALRRLRATPGTATTMIATLA